jgi:hypothetical protein
MAPSKEKSMRPASDKGRPIGVQKPQRKGKANETQSLIEKTSERDGFDPHELLVSSFTVTANSTNEESRITSTWTTQRVAYHCRKF